MSVIALPMSTRDATPAQMAWQSSPASFLNCLLAVDLRTGGLALAA